MTEENQLVFAPLGGLGEIGMNCALYGFGPAKKRKWLMVDLGVAFAGDDLPGVDLIMPDTKFIEKAKKDLVGIIITHAHEDHIGALVDLWPRLGVKVYATRFAAGLLEARRLGEPGAPKIPIQIVPQGGRVDIGPFGIGGGGDGEKGPGQREPEPAHRAPDAGPGRRVQCAGKGT